MDNVKLWACPACPARHATHLVEPHTPFHHCPGTRGLFIPYVQAGLRAKIVVVERADYVGKAIVNLDPELGRPVSGVEIVRDEGNDWTVFADCATASLD